MKQGDKVRFTPNNKAPMIIEGVLMDEVNGGKGWHIYSPLNHDPYRIVRVWMEDGEMELLEKHQPEAKEPTPVKAKHVEMEPVPDGVFGLSWAQIGAMQGAEVKL